MVSGAAHTTAHTIRPALEVVRTLPGVSVVSSVFFMCLRDQVLVYGDCAVNPDPTAEQLADIAISSAATAAAFGVEPRVAMLSYSTGASGTGTDVEKVIEATAMVRERAPDLLVEGPIQYDAAIDAAVAADQAAGARRWRGGPPCSSSRTSTPATTPTRRCSARPAPRGRPDPPGAAQAGERPVPRRHRARHRQHGRDHRDPGAGRTLSPARPAQASGRCPQRHAVRRCGDRPLGGRRAGIGHFGAAPTGGSLVRRACHDVGTDA